MFGFDDILFTVSLAIGVLLAVGSAFGAADLSPEADLEGDAPAGLLDLLGLGRVPLVVLVMLLSLLFGATGMVISPALHDLFGAIAGGVVALLAAAAAALLGTRALSRVLARVMPRTESYASDKQTLAGRSGTVIVAGRSGDVVVRVLDEGGAELRVRCVVQGASVRGGDAVFLIDYEPEKDRFLAEKLSLG